MSTTRPEESAVHGIGPAHVGGHHAVGQDLVGLTAGGGLRQRRIAPGSATVTTLRSATDSTVVAGAVFEAAFTGSREHPVVIRNAAPANTDAGKNRIRLSWIHLLAHG